MTKRELMTKLDEIGVTYSKKATKAQLDALLSRNKYRRSHLQKPPP